MLGPSGSGKTVYLASLYKRLSTQGELGFFLEVDGDKRRKLTSIYTQIAIDENWPKGTQYSEVSEWNFTCRVQTEKLSEYGACQFNYLDYSGSRVTDELGEEDTELESEFRNSDTLLGLLDGVKLVAFMRNERIGRIWAIKDLPNMLNIMQGNGKPIHFVISKWDVVENEYSLKEIRERLLEIEEFSNIVKARNQAGSPVRLIPVSSVGSGFAIPQSDGTMKKTGSLPKPFQVEAPLACVFPDMIKTTLEQLMKEKAEEEKRVVEVKPNLSFWDRVGQTLGNSLRAIRNSLPKKYQFADDILGSLIEFSEESAHKKQEAAIRRTDELRRQQVESLKKVNDEETALRHAVNCFISIKNKLDAQFPESEIKLP